MRRLLIIIMMVSLFYACNNISETERKEIKDVVVRYNHALMKAYETGSLDSLKEVTTERQYRKVMVYIQSYAAAGEKIEARLKEFKLKDIRKTDDKKGEAVTTERWYYKRIDQRTGETLIPETLYEYSMKYKITKDKDNKWRVDSLKVLSEKKESLTLKRQTD